MPIDNFRILASEEDFRPALTLGQGLPRSIKLKLGNDVKEVPVAYFWKDVIAIGDYCHPDTGQEFSVDANRLKHWDQTFKLMRQNGIDIPIPRDHKEKASENVGFVVDSRVQGSKLMLLHQIIGEEGAMEALRNRVSVKIMPSYKDAKGRVYKDAIVHSSLTPIPVITGQEAFSPLAASRGQQGDDPVFELAASRTGGSNMELLARLREVFGADKSEDEIIACCREMQASRATATEKDTMCSRLQTQVADLTAQLEASEAQVVELSRSSNLPDDSTMLLLGRSLKSEIDAAISSGGITPATAEAVKGLFGKDKLNALALSRTDGSEEPLAFRLFGILKANKPTPKAGESTGAQVLALGREGGEAKDDEGKGLQEIAKKMYGKKKN